LVFFVIGIPGALFTFALLSIREPKRRGIVHRAGKSDIPFGEVLAYVRSNWKTFFCHCAGFGFFALIGYAGAYWVPATFVRTHLWSLAEVGLRYGLAVIVFGSGGIIFGGQLADWMSRKGYTAAKMRVGLLAVLIHLPAGILFPLVSNDWLAFAILCPAIFAIGMPFGVAPAAIQEMMPNQMRGQAAALYLFVVNLIGMGIGPFAVGWISDYIEKDGSRINEALAITNVSANIVAIVLLYFGIGLFRNSLDYRDNWHNSQAQA
jgi:MFS family permease